MHIDNLKTVQNLLTERENLINRLDDMQRSKVRISTGIRNFTLLDQTVDPSRQGHYVRVLANKLRDNIDIIEMIVMKALRETLKELDEELAQLGVTTDE